MATQKTPTKKKSQQNDDDSMLKWIAIGGLAAILVGGTVLGLVAAVLDSDSAPQTAQAQQTDAAKKKNDKKKKDDEKEKNRAKEEQKAKEAKAREEQQKKENDAKFEEWYKKGETELLKDEPVNANQLKVPLNARIDQINIAISCFEKALDYAQSNSQKHRANLGLASSYFGRKKLSSLSQQEKERESESADNAVKFAVTSEEKEKAHVNRAGLYEENGMYKQAITEWTEASNCALQDEKSKGRGVIYLLGPGMIALKNLHDVDTAKSLFQRGLDLSEELPKKEDFDRPAFLTCLAIVAAVERNNPEGIRLLKLAKEDNPAVMNQVWKTHYPDVKRIYNIPSKTP